MKEMDFKKSYEEHTHNGVDSKQINFTNLKFTKGASVTAPTGGATVDAESRTAINAIITRLETLGLIELN